MRASLLATSADMDTEATKADCATSESQRAMVASKLKGVYAKLAKERQKRKPKSVSANLHEQNGKASTEAAAAVNVSARSVDHATTSEPRRRY